MTKIIVSVIIPSYNSSQTIVKCLASLKQQKTLEQFEVIVVDSSSDQTASIIEQNFPWVKLYTFSKRKFAGSARNFGVSHSAGEIIAFIDADCFVDPDWICQIIATHKQTELPLIGGAIDNGNPESYTGWGYYFSSFNRWLPQQKENQYKDLATGSLTVKKWLLEQYGVFSDEQFCEDTDFSWRIAKAGYPLLFMPTLKVYHVNLEDVRECLIRKIQHGRFFAHMRKEKYGFSSIQRVVYALGTPFLPFLLLFRCTVQVIHSRSYLWEFIKVFPLTFLYLICWSCGEFLGYLGSKAKAESELKS